MEDLKDKQVKQHTARKKSKGTYTTLFATLAVIMMLLPFVTVFNDFLTRLVENTIFYNYIEIYIIPHIIKIVIVVLRLIGIESRPATSSVFLVFKQGRSLSLQLSWNCLGWQSLVIFFISILTGFQGKFTFFSKLETITIGILGTFLLNIARIVLLSLGIIYANEFFAQILHDYFSVLISALWLMVFWWFSYRYVLTPLGVENKL
jgi:exosortase/archaeosortase family protein